jgi:putative hemolysin
MIDWDKTTKEETDLIRKIATRAMACNLARPGDRLNLEMDIAAAHIVTPMKLAELLAAKAEDFCHDIGGIRAYINRETGELQHCFLPRFAKAG